MRKPLSYSVYMRSNKRKNLGMIISIALGVFLIAVIQFYTYSMTDTYERGDTQYRYMSQIWSTKGNISKEIMSKIESSDSVEKIIRVNTHRYMINNILGSDTDYMGYYASENDIEYIMDKMGLKLASGRMPKNGEKEIIINENVARARNIKIGDYMGSDATKLDWFSGKYKVSGVMEGDNILSFIPRSDEEIKNNYSQYETCLIFPKTGRLDELNKLLESLPKQGINLCTYGSIEKMNAADDNNFNMIFNIVIIVMIVVLSVSLGNSAYVHYYQRRMEFGLLESVGLSQSEIILRAFKEIFISCVIGFVSGAVFIEIFKLMMNKIYLYPHGLSMFMIKPDLILRVLSIPIFISLFSLIPASRLLSKIEPISIIERNE